MRVSPLPEQIDVAVVHHDLILAAGIVSILGASPEVRVQPADAEHVDVVVFDYAKGLEAPAPVGRSARGMRARLIVSDRDGAWEVRRALEAGVQGYLTRESSQQQLLDAVRSLARGTRYVSERVAGRLADSLAEAPPTEREQDVLYLLADGLSNKEIGRRLNLSSGTVKAHLRNLFCKLDATSRTAAVAKARGRGFLEESEGRAA